MTTSRMHRHTLFEPTDPNDCMRGGVADLSGEFPSTNGLSDFVYGN